MNVHYYNEDIYNDDEEYGQFVNIDIEIMIPTQNKYNRTIKKNKNYILSFSQKKTFIEENSWFFKNITGFVIILLFFINMNFIYKQKND